VAMIASDLMPRVAKKLSSKFCVYTSQFLGIDFDKYLW
jgi:hypothetical protein